MENYFNTLTSQIIKEYSKVLDEIIKLKLGKIALDSLKIGEIDLFREITNLLNSPYQVEYIVKKLEERGYSLEIKLPKMPNLFELKMENNKVTYTIQSKDVKVRVKKVILEA